MASSGSVKEASPPIPGFSGIDIAAELFCRKGCRGPRRLGEEAWRGP
eukprot:CAMPEP_0181467620 /NCGR_PEP_ID=MMETSP1110-20121109/37077_1 /TAXON_ID=174948 /ORGANISM="Symbiodinium sp., Strain CCMP421" /LENGTH=46 /DNA_ID= /DNA_START= /DNA_END= /DNA_ORIENTATION=